MPTPANRLETSTAVLTGLGGVAILFSIAIAQALFGLALLGLLWSELRSPRRLRFPSRLLWPVLSFIVWTLLSLAFSDAPLTGRHQAIKLVLFLILVLVANAFRDRRQILRVFQGLMAGATFTACYGAVQFVQDYVALRRRGLPFYRNYIFHQISGFMSHWLTFGAQLMMVLLLLFALKLFLPSLKLSLWWWICVVPLVVALLESFTRGIWLGTLTGLVYLLARWRRPVILLLIPAAILAIFLLAPRWLQQREKSIFDLHTDSSNMARIVMLRTGLAMIAAHPVFGIGPERVAPEFLHYKPAGLPLPDAWYGHLHNDYIQIAAERGVPCLLIVLWLFFEILRQGLLWGRRGEEEICAMGHLYFALTAALMVAGLFEYNIGDSEVFMLYLFLIAAVDCWVRLQGLSGSEAFGDRHGTEAPLFLAGGSAAIRSPGR